MQSKQLVRLRNLLKELFKPFLYRVAAYTLKNKILFSANLEKKENAEILSPGFLTAIDLKASIPLLHRSTGETKVEVRVPPELIYRTNTSDLDKRSLLQSTHEGVLAAPALSRRDAAEKRAARSVRIILLHLLGRRVLFLPAPPGPLQQQQAGTTCAHATFFGLETLSYHYWVSVGLPRAALTADYAESKNLSYFFVIPDHTPAFVESSLHLLFNAAVIKMSEVPNRVTWLIPSGQNVESSESWATKKNATTQPYAYKIPNKTTHARLHNRLQNILDRGANNFPKKLLISRGDVGRRDISNLDEVSEALKSLGFVTITPGEMSIDEQIQCFAHADTIVSPHGAALTNIVFSTEAHVIEIFGHKAKPTYCYLAKCLGHKYSCLRSKTKTHSDYDNFDAPLDELVSLLCAPTGRLPI